MGRIATLCALAVVFASCMLAAGADKDDDAYIKVDIRGKIETGIVAIGGETTGIVIHVKNVTWELDLGGNKDLEEAAKKLDKKDALVKGLYQKVKGVEIPERHIVKVASLKPPDDK
jgi:hypothetical protein